MKTRSLFAAAATLAFVSISSVSAQSVPATLTEVKPQLLINGTFDNGSFVSDVNSGVLDFEEFDAFCVEPLATLGYGDTVIYQVQDLSGLANYETIAQLVGGYLASARTAEDAAAVQWAIWEVINETSTSYSLAGGSVRVTVPVHQPTADLANAYLANAATFTPASLVFLTSDTHQNIVTWDIVPEPATAGLALLSGFFLLGRRRRN